MALGPLFLILILLKNGMHFYIDMQHKIILHQVVSLIFFHQNSHRGRRNRHPHLKIIIYGDFDTIFLSHSLLRLSFLTLCYFCYPIWYEPYFRLHSNFQCSPGVRPVLTFDLICWRCLLAKMMHGRCSLLLSLTEAPIFKFLLNLRIPSLNFF